jgi:hypothetical protein
MMNVRRWISGIVLCCAMIASSIAVLAFVTSWDIERAGKCFADITHSQFPKWLGCAMALHESLAAGLLAAIGALFGAWLAFNAVQDQIGMAKQNEREAARLKAERDMQEAYRDIERLNSAKSFVNHMVQSFPQGERPLDLARQLLTFRRVGRLDVSHSQFARAPEDIGSAIANMMTQLQKIADNLYEETNDLERATVRAGYVDRAGAEIIARIDALRQVSDIIDAKMPAYQARLTDADRKMKATA